MNKLTHMGLVFIAAIFMTVLAHAVEVGPTPVKAGDSLAGEFSQKRYLVGFPAPLLTTGEFFVVPEKGLVWKISKPFESRLIITDTGITQISHGSVTTVDGSNGFAATINNIMGPALRGDWARLEDKFDVQFEPAIGTDPWQVTLKPTDVLIGKVISKVTLHGKVKTDVIDTLKPNGDRDVIYLSSQKTFTTLTEAAAQAFLFEGNK